VTSLARDDELFIRPMDRVTRDLELFQQCFARNGSPRASATLEWQYLASPTGRIFVDFALTADQRLAAIYASMPVYVRLQDRVELGLQSCDTMTDSDYRGRGLFTKLAKITFARASEHGAKLVYGFPNKASAHGFFERLQWTNLDPVPFLIRPLRTRYVLERLPFGKYLRYLPDLPLPVGVAPRRGDHVQTLELFDDRATRLWHAFAAKTDIAVERDDRYLNWRLRKPGEPYESAGLFRGDELIALVSHCVKEKHGGRIGYVMEALCAQGKTRELRHLLGRALRSMVRERADVALAWAFPHSPNYSSFRRLGFMPFPSRFRPIELHFGARTFDPALTVPLRRAAWYMSYLDSDTV
jgi:GNAT superfamily N-acetyltransferase